jgi:hypothetical protein
MAAYTGEGARSAQQSSADSASLRTAWPLVAAVTALLVCFASAWWSWQVVPETAAASDPWWRWWLKPYEQNAFARLPYVGVEQSCPATATATATATANATSSCARKAGACCARRGKLPRTPARAKCAFFRFSLAASGQSTTRDSVTCALGEYSEGVVPLRPYRNGFLGLHCAGIRCTGIRCTSLRLNVTVTAFALSMVMVQLACVAGQDDASPDQPAKV